MMVRVLIYGYCRGVAEFAADRAGDVRRCGVPLLGGGPAPRSRYHRGVPAGAVDALGAVVRAGFAVMPAGGTGEAGARGAGRNQDQGQRLEAQSDELRADGEGEKELAAEVQALLAEAARVDAEEDGKYGKGKRGDELPKELGRRESRLEKIREAQAALEQEAREAAEKEAGGGCGAIKGAGEAGGRTGTEVWRAVAAGAGPARGEAGAASATEFYRPGIADHEGRSDERVCPSL